MLKKKSIFIRLLIPVMLVMLLQVALISLVLFANGTIRSLEDNAIETLQKNTEKSKIVLENDMVDNWSNLERLEAESLLVISNYLEAAGISFEEAYADPVHLNNILDQLSDPVINALRSSSATGVFFYLADEDLQKDVLSYPGLYYSDPDPLSTPADYSDISFVRGPVDIARKDNIQLDRLWNETFTFVRDEASWPVHANPIQAAREKPFLSPKDLAYWSAPHQLHSTSLLDSDERITYTQPLLLNGKIIGVIGTEVRVEWLKRYFPASDFGRSGKSGYMLISYDADTTADSLDCRVYSVTGSYINRLISNRESIRLVPSDKIGAYTITDDDFEDVQVVLQPLRLYNSNAPYSNEQWALAAIGTNDLLFRASNSIRTGIFFSSFFAILIGAILLTFVIRIFTKPLSQIVDQVEQDTDNPIIVPKSNTYEIQLLCSTLNAMRSKRKAMETSLRDERQRYRLALESATDTFMEYDREKDSLMFYYFSTEDPRADTASYIISNFSARLHSGEICHEDDIYLFQLLLDAKTQDFIEVRVNKELFSHYADIQPDGAYYWLALKASYLHDEDGNIKKIIGIARQITDDKRRELARIEAERRDLTTNLYNRDYGMQLIQSRLSTEWKDLSPLCFCVIRTVHLDLFEAHYGRVFTGVILMRFGQILRASLPPNCVAVRLWSDEFLIGLSKHNIEQAQEYIDSLHEKIDTIYTGENPDLHFRIHAGISSSEDAHDYDSLLHAARLAVQYVEKSDTLLQRYDQLPKSALEETALGTKKPINVFLSPPNKDDIVGLVLEVFERTNDVHSVINGIILLLGELFSLQKVIICSFDIDFGSTDISYQWTQEGTSTVKGSNKKISHQDYDELALLFGENGTLLCNSRSFPGDKALVHRLLCVQPEETFSTFCCLMYENGTHTGRILFQSADPQREWLESEMHSLHEISKIISAHISIEKSTSASKAKSDFLSRISHEIRTPMNAIIGMTGIAKDLVDDPQKTIDCLNKIDFSAKHLLGLINDVLDMSRIESGRMQLEHELFSLNSLVESVDTLMRPSLEGKGIHFAIETDYSHSHVLGDEYRLRQVLINLLSNAGKFTDPQGMVTLLFQEKTSDDPAFGKYLFSVQDTGEGIAPEDQVHIFNAFEQAQSGLKQRSGGTGLGLAISSNIITAMDSRIKLDSEVGKGSTFYFTLRLKLGDVQIDPMQESLTDNAPSTFHFGGKKVLLVEDNAINLEIASYVLSEAGFVIDTALNGLEAVEMFNASNPGEYDVILMDIQMPIMDGLTATREIRKNPARSDARTIPIIAMTANAFDGDMKKSIDSGMNGHIAKPFDNHELYSLLDALFQAED